MTNWIELAERVEALDGPCRETDLDVWWWCKANRGSTKEGMPEDYRKLILRMNDVPRYTASTDAAMTLWDRAERLIINIAQDGITTVILGGSENTASAPPPRLDRRMPSHPRRNGEQP